MMVSFRRLFSIILLFTLGLTLGAEALGKTAHVPVCGVETSTSFEGHQDSHATQKNGCETPASASEKHPACSDPCHLGQPHFGHASFLTSATGLRYLVEAPSSAGVFAVKTALESPVLEGPRRPPRFC